MGVGNLAVKKFYIVWDEMELKILLPDTNKPETIKLGDIISVAQFLTGQLLP